MIVDSPAVVAILRAEYDVVIYAEALAQADSALMSAANWLEKAIVVDSARNPIASRRLDEMLSTAGITVVAVTPEQTPRPSARHRRT